VLGLRSLLIELRVAARAQDKEEGEVEEDEPDGE